MNIKEPNLQYKIKLILNTKIDSKNYENKLNLDNITINNS